MTEKSTEIALFRGKQIRKTIHNDEWWFSVTDVIEILTETKNPIDYIKKVRKRDQELAEGWGQIVTPLKLETAGGIQKVNCAGSSRTESARLKA